MVLGEMRVRNVSGKTQKVLAVSEATGSHFIKKKKVPEGKTLICRGVLQKAKFCRKNYLWKRVIIFKKNILKINKSHNVS